MKINKQPEDKVIDLTYMGNHNTMPVIRELEANPVTGSVITIRSVTDPPESRRDAFADSPLQFIEEDKGQGLIKQPYTPPDPDRAVIQPKRTK